jgi:hypothetical protein
MPRGLFGQKRLDSTAALGLTVLDLVLLRLAHQRKILRQHDQPRLLADSLLDQALGLQQVCTDIRPGGHLYTCNNTHSDHSPCFNRARITQ